MDRASLLAVVAELVPAATGDGCVRVAVDGADGAGKTRFAAELAAALRATGRDVVTVSVDGFHQPRAVRYRRGRSSPIGFWLDSYDYRRLWADVLTPLGPDGDRWFRAAAHDVDTDQPVPAPPELAPAGAVLIVDGIFLQRPELAGAWEQVIFLAVTPAARARRLADRDGSVPDPAHPSLRRYLDGQRYYVARVQPQRAADVLIDNDDLADPVLLRPAR